MPAVSPLWRRGFDEAERRLAPGLQTLVRSEPVAVALGLAFQAQRRARAETTRATRRWLHLVNLPAGTDVTRILAEIGQLKRQVGELAGQLEAARSSTTTSGPVALDGASGPTVIDLREGVTDGVAASH